MLKFGIVTETRSLSENSFIECQVKYDFTTNWFPIVSMNGIEWTPKIGSTVSILIDKVGDGVVIGQLVSQVIPNDRISIRNATIGTVAIINGSNLPTALMNINGIEREVVLKA